MDSSGSAGEGGSSGFNTVEEVGSPVPPDELQISLTAVMEVTQLLLKAVEEEERIRNKTNVKKWGRISPCPTGMANPANNCYMNSILQTMTYTSPVYKELTENPSFASSSKRERFQICKELCQMMTAFRAEGNDPFVPMPFISNQTEISPYFEYKEQQDAMECWTGLVDRICYERPHLETALSGNFRIKMLCTTCDTDEVHRERFTDIALDMSVEELTTVDRSLEKYFSQEVIEDCICDACGSRKTKVKAVWVENLPDILVFQMKRFNLAEKNCGYVDFPQEVEMEKYLAPDHYEKEDAVYRLYSVVAHYGHTPKSGHYTAYIKAPDGQWRHFDDDRVVVTTVEACHQAEDPYILFYERRKMKPRYRYLQQRALSRCRLLLLNITDRYREWRPLMHRFVLLVCLEVIPQYCDLFLEVKLRLPFLKKVYLLYRDIQVKLQQKPSICCQKPPICYEETISKPKLSTQVYDSPTGRSFFDYVSLSSSTEQNKNGQDLFYIQRKPKVPDVKAKTIPEEYSEIDEEIEGEQDSYSSDFPSYDSVKEYSNSVSTTTSSDDAMSARVQSESDSSTDESVYHKHEAVGTRRKRTTFQNVRQVDSLSSSSSSGFQSGSSTSTSGVYPASASVESVVSSDTSQPKLQANNENSNNNNSGPWSLKQGLYSTLSSLFKTGTNIYNIYNSSVL